MIEMELTEPSEAMRATRNASKGTPPAAKKGGKGTPGKGTPKAEKKEDINLTEKKEDSSNTEADPIAASEAAVEQPQSSPSIDAKLEVAVASDENKEEKAEAAEKTETQKDTEESTTKSSVVVMEEIAQDPEEESDKAVEESKESALKAEEEKESAPEQAGAEASEVVEEAVTEKEVLGGADDKMQEDNAEEQVEDAGPDDAGKEEAEEDDEEEDDDGEGDAEEDDEGDDDELVDQGPITERQKRKRLEVFVGGLDRDATVDDVRSTFEAVGDVQEIRLMTHPQTGKNRGYAFVRFLTAEQAMRAAMELDRTKIRDKECAVVPSEENDTLFVGNICKSWSSEQVTEKLKEYGVEGIDEMVLSEDQENEGHNRGHAFLEFVSHTDAIKAFKRLSKPDAIFGSDRSAKVAWAEGSYEPDEAVKAKIKSIFVSGLPEEWESGKLKEQFGKYGEIERVVLAKNISKSKRTDFAFVHFAARDAAVAAIEALNDAELSDGDKKVKLKVELAKPTPRKKRMRGHRGSYPVGGTPSKQRKGDVRGDQRRGGGGRGDQRRGEGGGSDQRKGGSGRGISHGGPGSRVGSQKNFGGSRRKVQESRSLPEEKSRDRHDRGSRNSRAGAAVPRVNSGSRVGSSFKRGRIGAYEDEDYMPLGARISPGYTPPVRPYTGRQPREAAYPLRPERGVPYSGLGAKRSYSAVDEEAAYYGSGARGYPRARMEYGDHALYSDHLRATSLGHGSLGHVLPRNAHGYSSAYAGAPDYGGYANTSARAADPRGAAYPSSYYGSQGGSGYSHPGGAGPYY